MLIGFVLLVLSAFLSVEIRGKGQFGFVIIILTFAWLPAIFVTDKYVHKYPQQYDAYLIATHSKAAIIMALFLLLLSNLFNPVAMPSGVLWFGFAFFVVADALVSLPRRQAKLDNGVSIQGRSNAEVVFGVSNEADETSLKPVIDTQVILDQIPEVLGESIAKFVGNNLPDEQGDNVEVLVVDESNSLSISPEFNPVGLLISETRLNDIRRLNQFLLICVQRMALGGYFVGRYTPHEMVVDGLKTRYPGWIYRFVYLTHFIWFRVFPKIPRLNSFYFWLTKGRNRIFSKVEIWGRLSYCGMKVMAETQKNGEIYLLAQKIGTPVQNKKPSYYPVVALEKVGLDGKIFRTHKLRSMYPFSEFLQKQVFDEQGLAATGKFKDDYRLTEYGKFIRKYWLDELLGIWDWLRGDIKLVGIRATSPHFLSLYPKEFYDLYIQIKPGLIPPIFDESTDGISPGLI